MFLELPAGKALLSQFLQLSLGLAFYLIFLYRPVGKALDYYYFKCQIIFMHQLNLSV